MKKRARARVCMCMCARVRSCVRECVRALSGARIQCAHRQHSREGRRASAQEKYVRVRVRARMQRDAFVRALRAAARGTVSQRDGVFTYRVFAEASAPVEANVSFEFRAKHPRPQLGIPSCLTPSSLHHPRWPSPFKRPRFPAALISRPDLPTQFPALISRPDFPPSFPALIFRPVPRPLRSLTLPHVFARPRVPARLRERARARLSRATPSPPTGGHPRSSRAASFRAGPDRAGPGRVRPCTGHG